MSPRADVTNQLAWARRAFRDIVLAIAADRIAPPTTSSALKRATCSASRRHDLDFGGGRAASAGGRRLARFRRDAATSCSRRSAAAAWARSFARAIASSSATSRSRSRRCPAPLTTNASAAKPECSRASNIPASSPIHEYGRLADGRGYYAMRLVPGDRLADRVRRLPALPDRLRLFDRICDVVAFAHARGIVHRDLKPANIMVGAFGEVLVLDWGLARRATMSHAGRRSSRGRIGHRRLHGAGAGGGSRRRAVRHLFAGRAAADLVAGQTTMTSRQVRPCCRSSGARRLDAASHRYPGVGRSGRRRAALR